MDTKERGVMEEKVYHPIKNETIHGNSFDYKSFDSKKDEQIQRNKGERSTRNIDNEKTTPVDLKKQKLVPESEYNDPTDEDDEHLFEKDHTFLCTSVCPGACADEEESAFRCDEEAVLVSFINSDEVRVRAEEKQSCKPEYALSPPDDINSIRRIITDGNIVTSVSPGGNLLSFDNLTSDPEDGTTSVSYRSLDVVKICSSLGRLKLSNVVEEQIQLEEARSVLESTTSQRSATKGIRGQGEVANGERRHLLAIAEAWTKLKYSSEVGQSDREEGVILLDDIVIKSGCYRECVDWQTTDFLGQGMFGKCHLAIDNSNSNVRFCCKKIKLERYNQTELTVWSNLTHPSIVRLYGAVRLRNEIYIFSELMEGGSLMNVIAGSPYGQLNSWLALQYFQQLLYVLVYLEEKRVIHEDLKTDNILVRAQNIRLAVADFGLACVLPDNQQRTPPDLSPVGGQAQYSPEKASSKGHDFGSDLWAAVCDFVEMLSGYAPWTQRFKQARLLHYVIYWKSPPIEDIPAGLPDDINNLIIRGWTVDSTQRPSASTLLQHRAFHLLS